MNDWDWNPLGYAYDIHSGLFFFLFWLRYKLYNINTVGDQKVSDQKVTHFLKILEILETMKKNYKIIQNLEYKIKTYSCESSESV